MVTGVMVGRWTTAIESLNWPRWCQFWPSYDNWTV